MVRRMPSLPRAAALLALLVAVPLAACGGGGGQDRPVLVGSYPADTAVVPPGLQSIRLDFDDEVEIFRLEAVRLSRDGLAQGMKLAQGDTIGYVGTTGNAPANTPHLHFQLMRARFDTRWWDGDAVDPRPYFVRVGESR